MLIVMLPAVDFNDSLNEFIEAELGPQLDEFCQTFDFTMIEFYFETVAQLLDEHLVAKVPNRDLTCFTLIGWLNHTTVLIASIEP